MNETVRTLTLRKKGGRKQQISAPKQISGPTSTKESGGRQPDLPRERPGQSETSDLVKRRYSTRFNQLPDFSSGAPAVPGLPGHLKRSSHGGSPSRPARSGPAHAHALQVDVNALADPNLQPERYVTELLSHASEHDIQEFQNSLRRVKNRTSTDLQQNVYQNRTQFIKISKEAEKLKSEIDILRGLMSELTGALGQTNTVSTHSNISMSPLNGDSQSRKKANRSSVANLESMWNVQLQALWKNVERSQKFLPAIPGRHIVMETGQWVELDSATWKAKRPVHIVLLNDHLLVASVKRKRTDPNDPNQKGPAPTKLVAEECWHLQDIELADLGANLAAAGASAVADERDIGTALNVRSGGKSFTYRHQRRDLAAKTELLLTFRKALEDLRKTTRAETEKSSPPNESLNYFASRDPASAKKPEIMDRAASPRLQPEILVEVDGKQQNMRWVESQVDDLDIDIALQRFESATEKVERLRKLAKGLKGNSIAQELMLTKVNERAAKLALTLIRALVDTPSFLEATKTNTAFLTRLGFEDRAREAYLRARTDTLTKRARQCVFEGDLHRYIFQISYVYFAVIKKTVEIYQACFAQLMMSACIKWTTGHLETFNALLIRQLSSVERGGNVWRECMDVVWGHEREMLGEVGLDFREMVGRGLEIRRDANSNSSTAGSGSSVSGASPRANGTSTTSTLSGTTANGSLKNGDVKLDNNPSQLSGSSVRSTRASESGVGRAR